MTSILLNPCLSMPHPTKPSNFKILGLGLLFSIPIRRRNIIHTNSITCEKKDDVFYMRKCVELARTAIGRTSPNPMVGCVIVNDGGDIVGEGFHPKAGEPHAEVFALRNAGSLAENATAYVSLEPCNHYGRTPPCTEALIGAKVKRVVVGMVDPNPIVASKGVEKLRASGIDVTVGVEEMLCQKLNEAYIHRMLTGKPFVTLRYSLSFERKILNKLGQGSEEPGEHYPQMLQEYDGIVSSSNLFSRISSLPSAQETGAIQPLQIIIASGESSLRLACSITKSPDRVIVLAEKSVTVEPEYEGFKVVVLEQMKLSSIVDYCGSRELCNVVLDLRGDYGGFVTLVEDGLDENLVQKVVIELCSDQDRIEEFPILTFGRKSLRLKDLKSRALNESVIIEGYLL